MKERTSELIDRILLSRPTAFSIGERRFMLYPETLGSSVLLSYMLEDLEIDPELMHINPTVEAMRLCTLHPDIVCGIIAVTVCRGDTCMDETRLKELRKFFRDNLNMEDMSQLFILIMTRSVLPELMRLTGLDKDREEAHRIAEYKTRKGGSKQYGGRTIFGTILDNACSRYGWTDHFVIWEIPIERLRLMLADSVYTVTLSEEERQVLNIWAEGEMIDGDSADIETLRDLTSN